LPSSVQTRSWQDVADYVIYLPPGKDALVPIELILPPIEWPARTERGVTLHQMSVHAQVVFGIGICNRAVRSESLYENSVLSVAMLPCAVPNVIEVSLRNVGD